MTRQELRALKMIAAKKRPFSNVDKNGIVTYGYGYVNSAGKFEYPLNNYKQN